MSNCAKILLTSDIFRVPDSFVINNLSEALYYLLKMPIYSATNISLELCNTRQDISIQQDFYQLQFGHEEINENSWIKAYNAEPSEQLLDFVYRKYKDALILSFELSPILKKAFNHLSIPYLDMIIHPIRFLDDLFLGFSTNNDKIRQVLEKYKISENHIYNRANQQIARYIPNTYLNPIKENTLLIIGQTELDKVLIQKNGQVASLLDYKENLAELCKKHIQVYFKPHPSGTNKNIIDFFKAMANVKIIYDNFPLNSYQLLSHSSISTLAGLNSSVLVEGHYFEKKINNFIDFEYNFLQENKNQTSQDCFLINNKDCFNPQFWHEIYEKALGLTLEKRKFEQFLTLPNLRLFFRGAGSFDDATSYAQCKKIGVLENKISQFQKQE